MSVVSVVKTGLENFTSNPPTELLKANLGLLANPASVGPGFEHAVQLIDRTFPGRLKTLLGPQHGYAGEKQDNMVESGHSVQAGTHRPIYSLYGETRRPTPEMLAGLDALLIDLVDVGTRVYTFAHTISYCLEAAAETGIKIVILDRPNPIGGVEIEGNILKTDCSSFVGLHPIPMRHGLTIGELASYIAERASLRVDLTIIPVSGWHREQYFAETGLPWVMPSPNMPHPDTAWVYPGQVIWEGTNISEGRGTTRPFQLFGAPFIDPERVLAEIGKKGLAGAVFRPVSFEPTFHKHKGKVCRGFEIHPLDKKRYKPYLTALTFLEIFLALYPDDFSWKNPPYEYEFHRLPMDLILGDTNIRSCLEHGASAMELESQWRTDLDQYREARNKYLLY